MSTPMNKKRLENWYTLGQTGYVTLISVLIVGAVGVSVVTSLLLLGLGSNRSSYSLEELYGSHSFVTSCIEESLYQIQENENVTGYGSLSFGSGSCGYMIENQGGENRLITSSSTRGLSVRKISVTLDQVSPSPRVTSWRDVADF